MVVLWNGGNMISFTLSIASVIPPEFLHLWLPASVTEGMLYYSMVLLYIIQYRWHLGVS